MDPTTINEAGDSMTPSKNCHHRSRSVDSGIDVSGSSNLESDSTTETYSLQENGTADHAIVYHKKSETACSNINASFSQSSDSDICLRSISQESDESDFQGNAYCRYDSGFSSLDKSSPLGVDFGDSGVSEIEKGVIDVSTDAPSEAHTTHAKLPNHTAVVETCPTAITEMSNCFADPVEEVDHETLETRAIRKFYLDLSNVISQELDVISTALYSGGLIERTKLDEILAVLGKSNHSKAVMVLNTVLSKIEVSDPSKFHDFIRILEEHGVQEIAERITRTYFEFKKQLQQSSEVSEHASKYDNTRDLPQQPSSSSSQVEKYPANVGQISSTSSPCNSVSYLVSNLYSPFAISLFLVVSLLLLYLLLIVLCWTLNAGMKRNLMEKMHLCSAFDERGAIYNEEKQQLEEQLLIAQRQIIQLNREVLDLKKPKDHPCTSTYQPKITCEKQVQRLEQEKIDYIAKIENLKQQRDLLLND